MATHRYRHRHQSSLEGVIDFSIPLSLTAQQRQSARDLVTWLSHGYGLEQAGRKGYKPAALIQATLEHVASPDHFLTFLVSYIYEELCPKDTTVVDFNIDDALSYFDGLASRKPEQLNNLKEALEKCADYIVENFLLPRVFLPHPFVFSHVFSHTKHRLTCGFSQSLICQDATTDSHIIVIPAKLYSNRNQAACIRSTTELSCA